MARLTYAKLSSSLFFLNRSVSRGFPQTSPRPVGEEAAEAAAETHGNADGLLLDHQHRILGLHEEQTPLLTALRPEAEVGCLGGWQMVVAWLKTLITYNLMAPVQYLTNSRCSINGKKTKM